MNTTTQMETSNVTVQKVHGLGNQPPSTVQVKVQRPGDIPHRVQANPKSEAVSFGTEEMVFSALKDAAVIGNYGINWYYSLTKNLRSMP
jgi:hypothetical protein